MADRLGPDNVAVVLTDELPTLDIDIVWRTDHLPPAAATVLTTAATLTRTNHWSPESPEQSTN